MEEDEEVDIVGEDVSTANNELAISCISAGQILSCDYTVHPRWLTDSNDAVELWPENLPKPSSQDKMEMVQDEVVIEEPAAIDYDWCEELSNYGDLIFEQDIPATLEEEVVSNIGGDQNEVDLYKKELRNRTNPKSLLKSNCFQKKNNLSSKFTKMVLINKNLSRKSSFINATSSTIRSTIPTKKPTTTASNIISDYKNNRNRKPIEYSKTIRSVNRLNNFRLGKQSKTPNKRFIDLHGENITINHEMDVIHYRTNDANHIGAIKLSPTQSFKESDPEIDIESDSTSSTVEETVAAMEIFYDKTKEQESTKSKESTENLVLLNYPPELCLTMESLDPPSNELKLPFDTVIELEKYFHSEFFEGRPTKTPERYMKIRRYILNSWNEAKPLYVGKTSVRNGLKNCGDVNCISRIHMLLEQLGAINYGHCGQHFSYIRPLIKLYQSFMHATPNKTLMSEDVGQKCLPRQRQKKFFADTKFRDVNYTVSHNKHTPILLQSSPTSSKTTENPPKCTNDYENYIKPEFQLVKCLRFTGKQKPPFKISITLSTLLCLQLHSLSATHEVMGFIGGHREKSFGHINLRLTRYKPCKTSKQNGTMCEMCPVSQVEQSCSLLTENKELLGWFHSHPTFPPNPSRTDIRTQEEMQHQFSFDAEKPFIGFILGCIDTSYKCIYILPQDLHNVNVECVPYEMKVDIVNEFSNFFYEIQDVLNVIDRSDKIFSETIHRFICSSSKLLEEFGHKTDLLNYLKLL